MPVHFEIQSNYFNMQFVKYNQKLKVTVQNIGGSILPVTATCCHYTTCLSWGVQSLIIAGVSVSCISVKVVGRLLTEVDLTISQVESSWAKEQFNQASQPVNGQTNLDTKTLRTKHSRQRLERQEMQEQQVGYCI